MHDLLFSALTRDLDDIEAHARCLRRVSVAFTTHSLFFFSRVPLLPETPPYASTGSGLMTSDTSSSRSTPSSST